MKVTDIMTKNVMTCKRDASLKRAAAMMVEKDCGAIPVTDDEERPIGIITDRDIVLRTLGADKDPNATTVGECMTERCVTVPVGADVEDCCQLMEENQIRRVVVVDESGQCAGIIAQADIAQHASARKTGEVVREVSQSERIARAAGHALWTGTTKTAVALGTVAAAALVGGIGLARRRSQGLAERLADTSIGSRISSRLSRIAAAATA